MRLLRNQRHTSIIIGLALAFGFSTEMALGASFIDLGQVNNSKLDASSSFMDSEIEDKNLATETQTVYRQSGNLFGVIPMSFSVKAIMYSDGRLELRNPWYAFLLTKKRVKVGTGS